MAGLGGGRGGGLDRQTKEPCAVERPTSKSLNKTIEVCLTTKNRAFMADLALPLIRVEKNFRQNWPYRVSKEGEFCAAFKTVQKSGVRQTG